MSSFKLIVKAGLFSLVLAIFSIQLTGTVEAAWEPAQLQKLTEGCIASIKDQAQQDARKAANRKSLTLGSAFSTEVQRLSGKIQNACGCLTNKVSVKWASLEQVLQVASAEFDAFVKSQLQTGKCKLPDFSK